MRKITLSCVVLLCWSLLSAFGQTKQITGKVTDAKDGSPISGATVKAKGAAATTSTNADGTFSLSVDDKTKELEITYVGFLRQEVSVGNGNISINLRASDKSLTEVVVVGYGTKIKRDITSSIAKVTSKEFANLPMNSFESALQGRAAGVFINQGSGKLGQALTIRVRGISSISANQQPFIVVDGVPVRSGSLGTGDEPDNPLATLNPDDIESIEVLKDAAAAAIYGSRASNGVLLVTTKSGKAGKSKVSLGYFGGFGHATRKQKFLNAAQYKELFGAAAEYSGYDPADDFEDETGTRDWDANYNTDWAEQAFRKASLNQVNVSVNGGDAKTKFLVSSSLNDQKGIIIANRLQRATLRLNLDHAINEKFKIGMNLNLNRTKNFRVASDNAFTNPVQLNAIPSIQPLRTADGKYNPATLYYNNLLELASSTNTGTNFRTIGSAYIDWAITPNLSFRSQAGADWLNYQEESFNGKETLDGAPTGRSFANQVTSTIATNSNTFNFKKKFNDDNDFEALAGMEYQYGSVAGVRASGIGLPNDKFKKIQSAAVIDGGSSNESAYTFLSYFGKVNYKFKNRYLLGASYRVDGSSRFGKDNRYGSFPAASVGWIMSEENFLKDSKAISFMKLRTSYGKTGNAEIGNFSSLSLFTSSAYANIAGIILSSIGDPTLSWENTDQFDLGFDFGFFNNRISGEIDYFYKKTNNLLLDVNTPATSGITSITKNIGDMTNKGWEFVLNTTNIQGKNFSWTSSFNFSTYKNKITRLVVPVNPGSRTLGRLAVGQPYGQFFGKEYAGVDPENGDALYTQADGSKSNDVDAAPDKIIGDPNPKFYGGFNNHFTYKAFDLDVQCQFVSGNDLFNVAGIFQSVNGDYYDNQTVDQMAYWKKKGDITMVPQPRLYEGNGTEKSSRWVQDGSYFRVKSVNLGFNVPHRYLTKYKIDNIRLYAAATNLFTFTKYTGYDPEVSTYSGGINLGHDFYTPPQARNITFGVNLVF